MIKNTSTKYGSIAILFHWIMTILIIGLLCLGLYMTGLPKSPEKFQLYGWHKEYGLIVLVLALFRVSWRFYNTIPLLALPAWEKISARATHWLLYLLMFLMPITGFLMSSSAGIKVSFFGIFIVPTPIGPSETLRPIFSLAHEYLAYLFIALIVLHILAALKHYFIDKDDIMQRIV